MGKNSKKNYYGVRVGKDGPRIYRSWPECAQAVSGYSGARHKGFATLIEAEEYVHGWVISESRRNPSPPSSSPKDTSTPTALSTLQRDSAELFVPGLYFADPNPENSFEEGEADFIALPSSSPIKYCPSPSQRPQQSQTEKPRWSASPSPSPRAMSISSAKSEPIEPERTEDMVLDEILVKDERPDNIPVEVEPLSGPPLTRQQKQVLEHVMRGKSVFFTGSAGTGKSVLLRAIINALGGPSNRLAVTASTGIAAVNIGGSTLHSFAGCGLAKEPVDKLVGKIIGQKTLKHVRDRWRSTKTLLIDEISMVDASFFDKLETIARELRKSNKPFGGIQLVLSGDFCQLPPVPDRHDGAPVPVTFAFDAKSWDACIGTPVMLNKVFRQRDHTFVRMLNDMRFGKLDKESVRRFQALSRSVTYDDGIEPTELFPLRWEVETANATRLAKLPEPSHTYKSYDMPGVDIRGHPVTPQQAEQLLDRLVAVKELSLRVGAQVMLIKNLVQGSLVNGSLGQVIAFKNTLEAKLEFVEIAQVDDSQDLSGSQKSRRPGEVSLKAMDKICGKAHVWPLVRFTNGNKLLCVPVEFSVENSTGEPEAKRDQVPLILAWALSVHKSQGQTIERVKVNLSKTFEKGQAYVALSRATNMETLQVLSFDHSKVMAHPRVLEWHSDLEKKLEEDEVRNIAEEMDNEEAVRAFFQNDLV